MRTKRLKKLTNNVTYASSKVTVVLSPEISITVFLGGREPSIRYQTKLISHWIYVS